MNRTRLFTIVVPIYNVEKYLDQCLESLLYQTLINHRVILVNDGSTDRSGEIAKGYAHNYPELFVYVEQENAGLGAARNTGLNMVKTKYTMFLDSDDWLVPRFIERITARLAAEQEEPELIFTMPQIYNMADNRFEDWADMELFEQLFPSRETVVNPKEDTRIYGLEPSANRRIFLTHFLRIQNFSFPVGTKWEDVEPHFQLLHAANRCIGEISVGFCYRINSGNQITASSGPDRLQIVSVFARTLSNAYQHGWDSIVISYIFKMLLQFSKWSIAASSLSVRKELVQQLHSLYCIIPVSSLKEYCRNLSISKKDRWFIKIMRSLFYKIIGIPTYYNHLYQKMKMFQKVK